MYAKIVAIAMWTIGAGAMAMAGPQEGDKPDQAEADKPAERPYIAPVPTGFLFKTLEIDGRVHHCCVYVPPEYDPAKKWPVILFLHGSGERGSDGLVQTEVGIGREIRRHRERVPAIVVMPQCPDREDWSGANGAMAVKCVEATTREYSCDLSRIYITGLSLGGAGTWYIASKLPTVFAAVAPVCGFTGADDADRIATALKDLPIWIFHGEKDGAVPVEESRRMAEFLRAKGAKVQYTEYEGANHGIWDRVYDDPEFWKWLFAQHREAPAPGIEIKASDDAGAN